MEASHADLGTLANVVSSLARLSDSLSESLNGGDGDASDGLQGEHSASEITRWVRLRPALPLPSLVLYGNYYQW